MLKRFFAFLVSVALIASPLMAEGLNSSDLNFAFGTSDAQAPQLSSDLSIMTNQQMSETEGELLPVAVIGGIVARKVGKEVIKHAVKSAARANKIKKAKQAASEKAAKNKKEHTSNARPSTSNKHTKKRAGSTTSKARLKNGWY